MRVNEVNVVIVDDQTSARTMLRHILEDIGPELAVHDFGDPAAALAWCETNGPTSAARITACRGWTGWSSRAVSAARRCNRDVPIVLVTVVGDEPVARPRWKPASSTSWSSPCARANCAPAAATCCTCASRPRR
jgi:two-component system response regulator RpfG